MVAHKTVWDGSCLTDTRRKVLPFSRRNVRNRTKNQSNPHRPIVFDLFGNRIQSNSNFLMSSITELNRANRIQSVRFCFEKKNAQIISTVHFNNVDLYIPSFLVRFGGISGLFGLAMAIFARLYTSRQNTNHGSTKLAWQPHKRTRKKGTIRYK